MTINRNKVLGFIRHMMTGLGGYYVGEGLITNSDAQSLVSAFVVVLGLIWSWVSPEKSR